MRWKDRVSAADKPGRYRRGLGMARGFHTSSAGSPKPGDVIDFSGGMVKVNIDGSVDVITAVMDHGGGTLEAMAKLVAETLCVPLEKVEISPAGARTTMYDCVTHATRGVYAGGGAAVKAAKKVSAELLETAAQFMDLMPDSLTISLDEELGEGVVHSLTVPDRRMTIKEIARQCWIESRKTIAAAVSYRPVSCPPAYVSTFIEVEVDTWTGQVRTHRVAMGVDCGTVVNPDLVVGQLEGGMFKGAGFALLEDNRWDTNGQVLSSGYMVDAKTLGMSESPWLKEITTMFANTYEPTGPLGAKGVGEATTNPVAAAFANAVRNAIGIRFFDLPITPEKILAALNSQRADNDKEIHE
jgi:xanthine dehydrogenase molybdenum-binding subunit